MSKNIFLIAFVGSVIFFSSCLTGTEAQKNNEQTNLSNKENINTNISVNETKISPTPSKKTSIDTDWKKYEDKKLGVSFSYPAKLTLEKKGSQIRLFHRINFAHLDPCDAGDEPAKLAKLTDFDVTFSFSKTVKSTKTDTDKSDAQPSTESSEDDDFTEVGKLKGEFFWNASAGCGTNKYVYPLKNDLSLVFEQKIISIFNPAAFQYDENAEAVNQPDVIKPQEETEIIRKILESFEF
jgi:hypothetical protein